MHIKTILPGIIALAIIITACAVAPTASPTGKPAQSTPQVIPATSVAQTPTARITAAPSVHPPVSASPASPTSAYVQEAAVDPILASLAAQAIQAIKRQDYPLLATLVHPDGLRFAPYSYLWPEDQVFTPDEVRTILASSRIYHWGVEDGSGFPIDRSFPDYYQEFIYDVDFAQAEEIRYNRNIESASRINNILEFYPDAQIVEFYFSGFDPQYAGMDWRSLRLVFLPYNDTYRLAGIVHDEWGP